MFVEYADVNRAIESDQLIPHFQPLVDLRTGLLVGFEVLARWQHPLHGAILPKNFISLAEENGLIERLTEQIVRKAFKSSPVLSAPLSLSINISPLHLHDLNLPHQIRAAAEEAGFPLERLTIEITESALLDNLAQARRAACELKAMGCRLALDDFGTGYSSLGHLQALPFDEVKIDRSFVMNMTNTRESRKIVAAIIGLGLSLGLITLAEGVETEEQAEMLLCLGCQLGQGWLYGRPAPANAIPDMIAAEPHAVSSGLPKLLRNGLRASSLEAMPTQRLAQLQAIYDGAPVGLSFLDRNLCYVSINRRLAEMNGIPVADHLGRSVKELFPQRFSSYEPYLRRAFQGEAISGVEVSMPSCTPGQPDIINMVSYQPAWDEGGEVIGVSVAVMDITDSKQTQEALRESEDRHRYVFELNSQVQWVLDTEGNILQISSRWEETTGQSKERTRNLGWLDALHPDDVEPTMKTLRNALRAGQPIDVEYRLKTINGPWRWMRSRGSPCRGPSGEILRWYGSVEDISEHRQAEETRRRRQARAAKMQPSGLMLATGHM
jgi:PAS domain S-box-containing protein